MNTKLESVDTIGIIGATTTSITLSITGIGLIVLPKPTGIVCALSLANQVIHEIFISKNYKYKKQFEKDQPTNNRFDNIYIYRKSLHQNVNDRKELLNKE